MTGDKEDLQVFRRLAQNAEHLGPALGIGLGKRIVQDYELSLTARIRANVSRKRKLICSFIPSESSVKGNLAAEPFRISLGSRAATSVAAIDSPSTLS